MKSAGRVNEIKLEQAPSDLDSAKPRLTSTSVTLFKKPSGFFAEPFPIELTGQRIASFLEVAEQVNLLQLNKELKNYLRGRGKHVFEQAQLNQLLFTLVGAFQQPHPQYLPRGAAALLDKTMQLTEAQPVQRRLAQAVSGGLLANANQIPADPLHKAFKQAANLGLAKALLLALIRAHQLAKAQAMLANLPPFLISSADRLDYLFALMVSGYQNAAAAWIEQYPELLLQKGTVVDQDGEVFAGITPYQYTLCLKLTQMRKMIRELRVKEKSASSEEKLALPLAQAALQAEEFELSTNPAMEALKQKHLKLMERIKKAYPFYVAQYDSWTGQQCRDYWSRVIGGRVQGKWPVPLMQELFLPGREFNDKTDFSGAAALQALPEAKYSDGEAVYPWNQGHVGGCLGLISYPPEAKISERVKSLRQDQPWLIQQGEEYFIYGPRLPDDDKIDAAVAWEPIRMRDVNIKLLTATLKEPVFTAAGRTVEYNRRLEPVYAAVDQALVGRIVGSGFSFSWGNVNWRWASWGRGHAQGFRASQNLAGIIRLDVVRTAELADELNTVKQHLPKREAAAVSTPRPPSPFQ